MTAKHMRPILQNSFLTWQLNRSVFSFSQAKETKANIILWRNLCFRNSHVNSLFCYSNCALFTFVIWNYERVFNYNYNSFLCTRMNLYEFCCFIFCCFSSFIGLYLYMLVVQTFSGDDIKFKMYAFIGWGMNIVYCLFVSINKSILYIWNDWFFTLKSIKPKYMNLCTHIFWIYEMLYPYHLVMLIIWLIALTLFDFNWLWNVRLFTQLA